MNIEVTVPDGQSGPWRVETFTVSEEDAKWSQMRAAITRRWTEVVEPGTYKRLMRGDVVVMSNTRMEIITHRTIIRAARGHVLLNGLGLGVVLTAILGKPEVESVTVIEQSPDVIALVAPTYQPDPRVKIVQADAFEYKPQTRFNAVWHDIWDSICSDNLAGMKRLHRRYGRRAEWQGSWARELCEMQ